MIGYTKDFGLPWQVDYITAQVMDISNTESYQISKCVSADGMPDWLLIEILLHLPVKSIFRFQCVCKRWESLINDPSFAHLYSSRMVEKDGQHTLQWTLLFCYMNSYCGRIAPAYLGLHAAFKLCNSEYFELLLSPQFRYLNQGSLDSCRLLACDNGLLLCCISQYWQEFYTVCNPLTGHWVSLPRRQQLHKWVSIGFTVEPEDGSFQIVRIAEFSSSSSVLDLEIYSSKEGKWIERKLTCPSPVCLFITHRQAVAYKGVLHWREYNNRIIACDLRDDSDVCRLIDMPRDRDRDGQGVLRVSNGGLYYFEICTRLHTRGFNLWELKDYETGGWFLLYRISVNDICSADPRVLRTIRCVRFTLYPLALHPFDSDIVYLMCGDRLASCNLSTRILEIAQSDRLPLNCIDLWTVVPFVLPRWPTPVPRLQWQG